MNSISIDALVERFVGAMSKLDIVQRLALFAMAFQVRSLVPDEKFHSMGNGLYWIDDACLGQSDDTSEYIKAPAFVYEVNDLPWGGGALQKDAIESYLSAALHVVGNYLIPIYKKLFAPPCVTQDEIRFLISKGAAIVGTHREQFARGVFYGMMEDFCTAAYLLAPQIENFVRALYNVNNIAVFNAKNRPRGFGALLDDSAGASVMSPVPAFEFRCIFVDSRGLNLRNSLAHGNLTDDQVNGIEMFYVWWFALRMVVNLKMTPKA